jgi:siroheme synthase (precorrin-2 oxidase/ferrochelatase)
MSARYELLHYIGADDAEANEMVDRFRAEVLRNAADSIVAACPDHSDADEVWTDCHCDVAHDLRAQAALAAPTPAGGEQR